MADETVVNGEFCDYRTVKITEDAASAKISALTAKADGLERENAKIIHENEGLMQQIEQLKSSAEELSTEIVGLKKEVDRVESENKALIVVVARASDLEAEVSRLQHDLISPEELSSLRNMENVNKLEAIVNERDLSLAKIEKMEGVERQLRLTMELLRNELEEENEKLKVEIRTLKSSLKEKQSVISEFEKKEVAIDSLRGEGGKNMGKQRDWTIVGGSAVAAAAVVGMVYYTHARRRSLIDRIEEKRMGCVHDALRNPEDGVGVECGGGVEPEVELLLLAPLALGVYICVNSVWLPARVAQKLKVYLVVPFSFRRQEEGGDGAGGVSGDELELHVEASEEELVFGLKSGAGVMVERQTQATPAVEDFGPPVSPCDVHIPVEIG